MVGSKRFALKTGVELEGYVFSKKTDEPINVYKELNEAITVPDVGIITTDALTHQIEFALDPCVSKIELVEKLHGACNALPEDWDIRWQGVDPLIDTGSPKWCPKQRYKVIKRAVLADIGDAKRARGILQNGRYAALHMHVEVDPSSEMGIRLANWLNNQGVLYADKHGNADGSRLKNCWWGERGPWTRPERLPAPRWFETPDEMLAAWQAVPRLVRIRKDGIWMRDLKKTPVPGDIASEGTCWWGVRPRWSLGTIEFRLLPSLPPLYVPSAIDEIDALIHRILDGDPPERITDEEWWNLFLA